MSEWVLSSLVSFFLFGLWGFFPKLATDFHPKSALVCDTEEQSDHLEKSILSKAFRGELGTNDPDDQPAIEPLKRSLKEKLEHI